MARARGIYRRQDSAYWWIDVVLPDGRRLRQSAKTESRQQAVALVAKFKAEAFKQSAFGIKQRRSWQEAVVRYLALKSNLRSIEDVRRICRKLDASLGNLMLDQINGDMVHKVIQEMLSKGKKAATVNRYLALMRCLLRTARDEWQWIDTVPKIRLLTGEVERDRWLTREEAMRLVGACPSHLAALVRFALATGFATAFTALPTLLTGAIPASFNAVRPPPLRSLIQIGTIGVRRADPAPVSDGVWRSDDAGGSERRPGPGRQS